MDERLKPGVSAVVCCYNSADVIVPTVRALAGQDVPPGAGYEVLLVDNNCTDNTVQLAKEAWNNPGYPLRIIKEKTPGLIYARKAGVKSAVYDILLFVDDDNILAPDWVEKLSRFYREMPRVGAVGGHNEALLQGERPGWFDRFQNVYACGPRDVGAGVDPRKKFGAGLSFRTGVIRSILFSGPPLFLVGRTKNALIRGEDTEMSLRCVLMGWEFYYDPSLKLQHNLLPQRVNWDYVCRARKGGGVSGIILKIYFDLLENKEPGDYGAVVRFVLRKWKEYILQYKRRIFFINKEGTDTSFWFYRLLGMSRGLVTYRKTYRHIRRQIVDHFKTGRKSPDADG